MNRKKMMNPFTQYQRKYAQSFADDGKVRVF